jgi:hypothetical protein
MADGALPRTAHHPIESGWLEMADPADVVESPTLRGGR